MNSARFGHIPPHRPLALRIAANGAVYVDEVLMPATGEDPRITAARAVIDYARNLGHPARVLMREADGSTHRLVVTLDGQIHTDPDTPTPTAPAAEPDLGKTLAITKPAPTPASSPTPAPAEDPELLRDVLYLLAAHPLPPEDAQAETVPAWPVLRIELKSDGSATVEGTPVPRLHGVDKRQSAVAAAAVHARRIGLNRPVRAIAYDPDQTAWPVIIHPNGSASDGREPPTRKRR